MPLKYSHGHINCIRCIRSINAFSVACMCLFICATCNFTLPLYNGRFISILYNCSFDLVSLSNIMFIVNHVTLCRWCLNKKIPICVYIKMITGEVGLGVSTIWFGLYGVCVQVGCTVYTKWRQWHWVVALPWMSSSSSLISILAINEWSVGWSVWHLIDLPWPVLAMSRVTHKYPLVSRPGRLNLFMLPCHRQIVDRRRDLGQYVTAITTVGSLTAGIISLRLDAFHFQTFAIYVLAFLNSTQLNEHLWTQV